MSGTDGKVAALAERVWDAALADDPVDATAMGFHEYDALLPDNGPSAADEAERRLQDLRAQTLAVDAEPLGREDRVTRSALLAFLDTELAMQLPRHADWNVDPMLGPVAVLAGAGERQPVADAAQRADLLRRWREMAPYLDRYGAGLRRGLAAGTVAPAVLVRKVIAQIDGLLSAPLDASPLLELHQADRADWSDREQEACRAELSAIVAGDVLPALVRLRGLLEDDVLPRARPDDKAGLGALPGGAELYARAVRGFSTLDLTAEQVHEIGRAEVARTDAELTESGRRVLGSDGLADTLGRLLAGDGIRFADREELLAVAREVVERAEAAAPGWFGLRHDQPCLVRASPPQEEENAPFAYYWPPAADGSRPGVYYVNTSAPETRARFDIVVDACHEAVPGHHLQIAVARRLTGLPTFRRLGQPPAYQEGWGLYAEQAGEEMGLYRTDLDRIGRQAKDALRSCRLVVDTGLHALGWSRQDAIDYLTAHTAFPGELAAREVDRYLAWPGQALSYKLGQLEILALRQQVREHRGPAFDIRRFHDVVLGSGALPLITLRELVRTELC
ncbi:MAG TPA: DUF885 domain-containing protein [Mycobacteriales bacterium]